ncbi:hypothetical protein TNCV_3320441 [Trichonephila clavipes]|nr:hypothetical protein TNCV_3320441 [Trichonephila clavipes]
MVNFRLRIPPLKIPVCATASHVLPCQLDDALYAIISLSCATRETCEHSMAEAVREAVDENDGKRDLAVAVDGSWQKRGFLRRMAW